VVDAHLNITSPGCVVNGMTVSISGKLLVDQRTGVVGISKLLQGPLEEVLGAPNVQVSINEDNRRPLVLIEFSFELILQLLKVLIPLGREETELGAGNPIFEFSFQLLDAGDACVVVLIADYSS